MLKKLHLKRADAILIAALLLASGILFLLRGRGGDVTAAVSVDGETLYTIALAEVAEPYTLPLENGVVLQVSPGGIRFLSSDCPGRDCVNCGLLTRPGQAAACIPNRTLVTLSGKAPKGAPDAISY